MGRRAVQVLLLLAIFVVVWFAFDLGDLVGGGLGAADHDALSASADATLAGTGEGAATGPGLQGSPGGAQTQGADGAGGLSPLAAIVANGHAAQRWLAASPPDETEAKAAVGRIIRDANLAGNVIHRIRGFVRRREPQQVPLDLDEVIRDVVDLQGAMELLDASGGAQASHLDDLDALAQVADRWVIDIYPVRVGSLRAYRVIFE